METRAMASKITVLISFLIMTVVNTLANVLPFNGKYTGGIFESYPNLISPAKYTYVIVILIYGLMAHFTFYQLNMKKNNIQLIRPEIMEQIRILFIISSFSYTVWIVAWHYDYIAVSVMMNITNWICINLINQKLSKESISKKEKLFIRIPFSIYYAWVTIAVVINITIMLVSIRYQGFGFSEAVWTIGFLFVTLLVIAYKAFQYRDIIYCLTCTWFYLGLWIKHISNSGYGGQYLEIVIFLVIYIVFLLALASYLFLLKKKQ